MVTAHLLYLERTAAPAAPRCAVPRFEVTAKQDSFEPPLSPSREARLKAAFLSAFAAGYRSECARGRVSAANFRGIRKVVLVDADGNTDGNFVEGEPATIRATTTLTGTKKELH